MLPLDNGGFSEIGSRMLDDDNNRKRLAAWKQENQQLKECIKELVEALEDLANECEEWVDAKYKEHGEVYHPALQRRYDRDVEPVLKTRQLIAKARGEG